MAIIQKANVVLDISDDADEILYYKQKGFSVIDEYGNVIDAAQPTDLESYREAYYRVCNDVKLMKQQIDKLTVELDKYKLSDKSKTEKKK